MGAGDFQSGIGPAGFDPVAAPSLARSVRVPVAIRLDGATRDYLLDDNGRYFETHPVDQKAALALIVTLGTISSATSVGNKLRRISRLSARVTETVANDSVRAALKDLLDAGDITIELVEVDTSIPNALLVAVTYRNLRLPGSELRTIPVRL